MTSRFDASAGIPIPAGHNVFAAEYFSRSRGEPSVVLKKRNTSTKLFMSYNDVEHLISQLCELADSHDERIRLADN